MKKTVWLCSALMVGGIMFGFSGEVRAQSPEGKGGQAAISDGSRDRALKFLEGLQDGDKGKMYEAANLTPTLVEESREKLVYAKKYNLTEQQKAEYEHALRISGQIDFFISKLREILSKSSKLEIMQTKAEDTKQGVTRSVHFIKITYINKDKALHDKRGRAVKEMVLHLVELTRPVNGRSVHEFSFDGKDFEKMAARDFEALSYF
jgi:hypothetical protein